MKKSILFLMGILTGLGFLTGFLTGRNIQYKYDKEWMCFNKTVIDIQKFMALNPYFDTRTVGVQHNLNMPSPMFGTRVLSYRLFITPYINTKKGITMLSESYIDIKRDGLFEDNSPIKELFFDGRDLIITKEFSKWKLTYPDKFGVSNISKLLLIEEGSDNAKSK